MRRIRPWLAGLALLLAGPAAFADRSRVAEESDVVEAGDCAAEWSLQRRRERGAAAGRESALELDCGIGWRTELLAAFARQREAGERIDAVGLEALTALRDRAEGGIGWSLAVGLARERAGTGRWQDTEHFVAIEASWQPAPAWLLQARLGTLRERLERRDSTAWALALEHALGESTELSAELEGDDRHPPLAGLALRVGLGHEDLSMQFSAAAGLGEPRERRVGVALALEF